MAEREPYDDPRLWNDARLLAALRREEHTAFAEFFRRFTPLLTRRTRAWGVPAADRDDVVNDVLGDVALALARHTTAAPRSLAAYLVASLRHHLGGRARADQRRLQLASDVAPGTTMPRSLTPPSRDVDITKDIDVLVCSEYARRAADPEYPAVAAHPTIARFAEHLAATVSEEDRRLLVWLGHHVPLRTAAEWLGVSYAAAGKRAQRLRVRLRTRALRYAAELPEAERRTVHAFLRRATAPASHGSDAPSNRLPRDVAPRVRPAEETER